jgi:threonine/homoserine/homoserine lactone efflux protein
MDVDVVGAGVAVGLAVAMPVGPIGLMVVGLGRHDWRSGGAAACGVAAADLTWAVVAVTGGAAVATLPGVGVWQSVARSALVVIGVVLVAQGVRRFRSRGGAATPARSSRGPARWFAVMYGLTLPNPLTVAIFAAAAMRIGVGGRSGDAVSFAIVVGVTSLLWQLLLAAFGRHVLARTGPGLVLISWPVLG